MSFFTRHLKQGDDFMYGKKSENRFTIKFSHTDPAHLQVADTLNRQERGDKAQYIVDAVMHFINSDRVQDNLCPVRLDERHIEAVVKRILSNRQADGVAGFDTPAAAVAPSTDAIDIDVSPQPAEDIADSDISEALGEDGFNAIAGALEMFRRK